jgi:predicted O-methyltransferase YrrM
VNIVTEYIKYRWNAKKRHGIHSPFVYEFSDACLSLNVPKELKNIRKNLFETIRNSNKQIQVTDLGAGSMKMNRSRTVKDILKYGSSKGKWGELLYRISAFYQPRSILELGTSLGIGTWHMHYGASAANITSVEGCPETYGAMRFFTGVHLNNNNVELIQSSFNFYIDQLSSQKFDLIFIDGHHDGEALQSYMERLVPFSHDETIFLLDDIRWSNSMFQTWNKLKDSTNFHVSIDLFRMGILVRRPSQEKEHFILKL